MTDDQRQRKVELESVRDGGSEQARAMTILRLEVSGFMGIRVASITPDPTGLVVLRGRMGQGKSSVAEAATTLLWGRRGRARAGLQPPDRPINDESQLADVRIDLGDLVVEGRWTRTGTGGARAALLVRRPDGERVEEPPRQILDALVGHFADPIAFLESRPEDQVKAVVRVVGLERDLEALEAEVAASYERRTELGREASSTAKAADALERELASLAPGLTGGGDDDGDPVAELELARDSNAELDRLERDREELRRRGSETIARVAELEAELGRARAASEELRDAWRAADLAISAHSGRVDVEPILGRVRSIESAAERRAKARVASEARERARVAGKAHAEEEQNLEAARARVASLLASVEFPVPEMSYDSTTKQIALAGVPFSQASQGERLRAAAAIAMAGDPDVRVLFARNGSLLDDDARAELDRMARERGFQLWLEVVDSKREGPGVWIENGEAFQS